MLAELERYDWERLRAVRHYSLGEESAEGIPAAIKALAAADCREQAERLYWEIDHAVVFNDVIAESALPTVRCVLAAVQSCTAVARPLLLEVLVQISAGKPSHAEVKQGNTELAAACLRELCYGSAIFFHLLENGTEAERNHCIDLLGACALHDCHIREHVLWWFEKSEASRNEGDPQSEFLKNWLAELKS